MDGLKLALAVVLPLALADLVALDVVLARRVAGEAPRAGEGAAAATTASTRRAGSGSGSVSVAVPVSGSAPSPSPASAPASASASGSASAAVPASASASAPVSGKALVIYFGSGTAKLDEAAEETLGEVLAAMKGDAARRLAIVGHADGSGDVKHNRWLGDFRAKVIARWLELRGIPRARCRIAEVVLAAPMDAGVGGAAAPDAEDPNLARDRRVELLWEAGPTP